MMKKYGYLAGITENDLIVTANQRLSSHLRDQFDRDQREQKQAWASPTILPLSQWLSVLWSLHHPSTLLLDNHSNRLLWQEILTAESHDYPLMDTHRAAEQAQQAWQLCHQWSLPWARLKESQSEDIAAFVRWAERYQAKCEQNIWCDASRLTAQLIDAIPLLKEHLPRRVYCLGFDTLPPATQVFFDALALHCEIIVPKDFSPSASTQRLLLTDREMEFRLLAQWAKKQWRAHPQHSIGCIIPDLLSDRATVERIFREEFKEDLRDAVNIAGGDTLLSFPIIHTALTLIELMSGRALLQPQLTALLLSPYLQDGIVEGQQRALLDRRLRRSHEDAFNLTSFILQIKDLPLCPQLQHLFHSAIKIFSPKIKFGYALSEQSDEFVGEGVWSELIELLESERDSNTSINSDLTPSKWAILFTEILTHFGWPGDRPLESSEFQCVKSFQQQLRHYAGLDWLLNEQTLREASETFRQLLSNALFQPESNQRARIHVLGLLEASGLHFDQLWITNMNDDTWPRPPSPNPFIPIHWQRELAMPRSSGSHELHYAQQIMQRLQHSTSQLIASYSLQKHDEHRELAPSPLILDFIETTLSELQLEAPQALTANPPLEDWQDDKAPRIEQNENVRGGATILQRQAECPFRAFAEIRLQAKPFDEVELGLSAAERGSLVHAVMAELWRRLGDSQHLQQFSAEKLNLFVRESVRDVVLEVLPLPDDLNKHLCELEIQRLHQLVLQWLDLEQQRPPFKVTAIEQPIELKIAELSLHLQVDRIDTLEDGSQIIIDYKTGSPSPSSWFGERPDEPQLPLYALHAPEHIRGLVFAQIRAQIVKFNGITAETGKLPGVKSVQTPWPELIEQWQTTLTNLAENFCAGEASVAPKKYPTTCTYCHLASLCRINERESD